MKNPVAHFEIPGNDPDKLSEFYSQLFDWHIEKVPGEYEYWMIHTVDTDDQGMTKQTGGINGGIARRMAPEQKPLNYISVSSVDEYVEKARGMGANVMMDKTEVAGMGYFAQLVDPEGNMFAIWQDLQVSSLPL